MHSHFLFLCFLFPWVASCLLRVTDFVQLLNSAPTFYPCVYIVLFHLTMIHYTSPISTLWVGVKLQMDSIWMQLEPTKAHKKKIRIFFFFLKKTLLIYIYIYIYIYMCVCVCVCVCVLSKFSITRHYYVTSREFFHRSLSDGKSSKVFRILLSILAGLNNALRLLLLLSLLLFITYMLNIITCNNIDFRCISPDGWCHRIRRLHRSKNHYSTIVMDMALNYI